MKLRRLWLTGLIGLLTLALTSAQVKNNKDNAEKSAGDEAVKPAGPTSSTRPPLTGNPQIDYIHDPNLPHELLGYDLSDYPFYGLLPKDLLDPSYNFTCDDRLDGFYASIPHKCQVYHNCLFNKRYDFLCPNFTVFDQTNFICHYVSEVDCEGSEKHYDRNEILYVTTTTTTTTPAPPQIIYVQRNGPCRKWVNQPRRFMKCRRRRTTTTTTLAPDYYDYYDYYNDYYNYDDQHTTTTTARPRPRPRERHRTRLGPGRGDAATSRRGLRTLQGGGGATNSE